MMDAFAHLDMSVDDPIGDLELRMHAAQVDHALIVETWGKDNRACLESLIASTSQRLRVAFCFRIEEEPSVQHLHSAMVGALRVRTADLKALGTLASTLEYTEKWLMPHAESGIRELTEELFQLAAHHPGLRIFLPHMGWPRQNLRDDYGWWDCVSRLSVLPNLTVGVSAIAHFSREPFPHSDIEPFADRLLQIFRPESLVSGSDYPLFEKDRYAQYMKLAEDWISKGEKRESRLELDFFQNPETSQNFVRTKGRTALWKKSGS